MRDRYPMRCTGDWMGPREGGGNGIGVYRVEIEKDANGAERFGFDLIQKRACRLGAVRTDDGLQMNDETVARLARFYGAMVKFERVRY